MEKRILSIFLAIAMILSLGVVPTAALADDPAEPTVTGVTVTPSEADVAKGAEQSFSATVAGENDPGQDVMWSIDESVASGTSISGDGLLTVAQDEAAETLTIRATSDVDGSVSGTATMTVTEAVTTVTSVTIDPSEASVEPGGTQSFSATVGGENDPGQDVTWSIDESVASGTSISGDGLLTVAEDETAETLTVRATSDVDGSVSGTAAVTITEAAATVTNVTVDPSEASVEPGGTQSFSATVAGENNPSQDVTWSIDESVASGTSISGDGLLTVAEDETAEMLTIRATSDVDGSVSGTAAVTIPSNEPATINDSGLKYAICKQMGITPSGWDAYVVTIGGMESLTELDASDWGITDLTGLWTAVNLESLDLSGNPLTSGAVYYNEIFTGIEALTDLKELDLSNCDLGIKVGEPDNTGNPWSLFSYGVNYLESLEVLDLSGNHLKADFSFNLAQTKLRDLRELDLSDNELNSTYIQGGYIPYIEKIDISQNYIYIDESQDFYQYVIDIGIDKFVYDDMKNMADLFMVRAKNAGTWTYYYLEDGQYSIDFGEILGDSIDVYCNTFSSADTVKITMNGEKYTAGSLNTSADTISLSGLELGKEYELAFEVMHLSSDSETYTFSFTTKALPSSGSEDSAGILDANLQAAVCSKLGEDPATYEVTKADMASLTGSLKVYGVTNAEGIQYATGLSSSLYLYGTYSVMPDLSGITNITQLRIGSPNLTEITDLSNVKVKTLYIEDADNLVSLPSVTGMTALKTVKVIGGNNLAVLAGIDGCENLNSFTVEGCTTFDFSGLENTTATRLSIKYVENFTLPIIAALESLRIEGCGLKELPVAVTSMTNLEKLYLNENELSGMPQELTNLTKLEKLILENNAFEDIPESVTKLMGLTELVMTSNTMPVIYADLSGMTSLETLDLSGCELTVFPESVLNMSSLEELDLQANNITSIEGSMKNLTSLTTLNLEYNELFEFPEGILDLPAVKKLLTRFNLYTDIPEGIVDNLGDTLKTFNYGGKIKFGARSSEPSEETAAYSVHNALTENGADVRYIQEAGTLFSDLKKLDTSVGEISEVRDNTTKVQEYSLKLESGTTSITLTPTAIYDDTVINVNGTSVENGETIEVSLEEGLNTVSIICYNEYTPVFIDSNFSNTITYNLTIIVGSSTGDNFPAVGRTYYIDLRLKKENIDNYSMADSYFIHNARFKYDAEHQQYIVDVTTTRHSWITYLKYRDESGNLVDADCVDFDEEANTAVYRIYIENLEDDVYIAPNVVPMGYAPTCRIIFNTDSIVDITSDTPVIDKTYLMAVINKAETELTKGIYTDASYNVLKAAYDAAKAVYADDEATQTEVDNALDALNNALDRLEIDPDKLADKASLKATLDEAKAITQGNHTDTAWNALQDAVNDAQAVYDKVEASQSEVDVAAKSLKTAIALFNNSGDASELDKNNLKDGTYTLSADMIKTNHKDYSMANDAIEHNVTLTVSEGNYHITVMFKGLNIEGDFGYLARLKYYAAGFTYDSYGNPVGTVIPATVLSYQTDSNGNVIVDQYNDANNPYPKYLKFPLVKKASYEENIVPLQVFVPIMEAISTGSGTQDVLMRLDWTTLKAASTPIIEDPVDPVDPVKADKTALAAKLTEAKAIGKGDYTDDTYDTLQNAIHTAQAIMDSEYATQTEVNEQVAALTAAIAGLLKRPEETLDKDNLADGKYNVRVNLWHATQNKASMGNDALNHTALIEVISGKMYMSISTHPMQVGTIIASLASVQIEMANGSYVYADVIANNIEGGKPSAFRFAMPSTNTYIPVKMDPQVAVMGDEPVAARLRISWDTLVKASDDATVSSNTSLTTGTVEGLMDKPADITDKKTGVRLEADANVLLEGTTMKVRTITSGKDHEKARLALEDIGGDFVLSDITLLGPDNAVVQPNGTVKISIPAPKSLDVSMIAVYRINDDGTKTLLESEIVDGYVVFYTNHFSLYAIVEKTEEDVLAGSVVDDNSEDTGEKAIAELEKVVNAEKTAANSISLLWWLIPIALVAAAVTIFIVRRKIKISGTTA